MNGIGYFFWLAGMSWELFFGLPSVSVLTLVLSILAFLGLIAATIASALRPSATKKKWRWLLLPFLIPLVMLIFGVAYRHDVSGRSLENSIGEQVLHILLWSHIPIAILLTILVRKNPLVPIGLSFLQFWLSFCTYAVASMSVTGNWL